MFIISNLCRSLLTAWFRLWWFKLIKLNNTPISRMVQCFPVYPLAWWQALCLITINTYIHSLHKPAFVHTYFGFKSKYRCRSYLEHYTDTDSGIVLYPYYMSKDYQLTLRAYHNISSTKSTQARSCSQLGWYLKSTVCQMRCKCHGVQLGVLLHW